MEQGKTFDPTKPVQTRDGRAARILCDDALSTCGKTIVATVTTENGFEHPYKFHKDGCLCKSFKGGLDLINIPVVRKGWININPVGKYDDRPFSIGCIKNTRAEADKVARPERVACIEIEITEGEGLDET